MTREINQQEFKQTMISGMTDVTDTTQPVVDIWPYVELLIQQGFDLKYVLKNNLVEKVYRSNDERYDHVILPAHSQNNFVVLIVDRNKKAILGHHILDLDKLYQ